MAKEEGARREERWGYGSRGKVTEVVEVLYRREKKERCWEMVKGERH